MYRFPRFCLNLKIELLGEQFFFFFFKVLPRQMIVIISQVWESLIRSVEQCQGYIMLIKEVLLIDSRVHLRRFEPMWHTGRPPSLVSNAFRQPSHSTPIHHLTALCWHASRWCWILVEGWSRGVSPQRKVFLKKCSGFADDKDHNPQLTAGSASLASPLWYGWWFVLCTVKWH